MAEAHKYVGIFFLFVLVSFFIGMLVSSVVLSVKAIKKEHYDDGKTYFKNVGKFPQHPGVTDVDYWKAKTGTSE
jgi:hypothetical protein